MPNFRNLSTKLYTLNPNQEGFSMVIWVFLVVFIFSVLVVTGSFSLDGTKSTYSAIPSDTPTVSGAPKPSTSPAKTTDWSIDYELGSCEKGAIEAIVTLKGTEIGYFTFDVKQSDGTYKNLGTRVFTPSTLKYKILLLNSTGVDKNTWQINLYSGGTVSGDDGSGGILKTIKEGNPTNC